MFKFVKNLGKKNKIVSTEFMTDEEYIAAIEPRILKAWIDYDFLENMGIVGLFTENVKFTRDLTKEELDLCVQKMLYWYKIAGLVADEFSERSMKLDLASSDEYNNFLQKKIAGKISGSFSVRHNFFSANTIEMLFLESKGKMAHPELYVYENDAKAKEALDGWVNALASWKNVFFQRILLTALTHFAVMTGFENEA